jgi:hypothetical protein
MKYETHFQARDPANLGFGLEQASGGTTDALGTLPRFVPARWRPKQALLFVGDSQLRTFAARAGSEEPLIGDVSCVDPGRNVAWRWAVGIDAGDRRPCPHRTWAHTSAVIAPSTDCVTGERGVQPLPFVSGDWSGVGEEGPQFLRIILVAFVGTTHVQQQWPGVPESNTSHPPSLPCRERESNCNGRESTGHAGSAHLHLSVTT